MKTLGTGPFYAKMLIPWPNLLTVYDRNLQLYSRIDNIYLSSHCVSRVVNYNSRLFTWLAAGNS